MIALEAPSDGYAIRRLTPEDAEDWRRIRLEALQADPAAFGSTYEEERSRSLESFAARIPAAGADALFAAYLGDTIVGSATFVAETGAKFRHKGHLFGLYVSRGARRRGIGAALISAVLTHAGAHVETVLASVVTDNASARHLYKRLGFTVFGVETGGLKADGVYYDEEHMRIDVGPC